MLLGKLALLLLLACSFTQFSFSAAGGTPSGLAAPKCIRCPAPVVHKLGPLEPSRDMSEESRANWAWIHLQRRLEGANAHLLEVAQRILGSTHQMSGGAMEEGAEIPCGMR